MQPQHIYDTIARVHAEPEMCFEYWILSQVGIIPDMKEPQKAA